MDVHFQTLWAIQTTLDDCKECVNHKMTFSRSRVDSIYIPIKLLAIQLFANDKINGPFLLLIVCHNMYLMHTSRSCKASHGNDWFINHGRSNLLLLSPPLDVAAVVVVFLQSIFCLVPLDLFISHLIIGNRNEKNIENGDERTCALCHW